MENHPLFDRWTELLIANLSICQLYARHWLSTSLFRLTFTLLLLGTIFYPQFTRKRRRGSEMVNYLPKMIQLARQSLSQDSNQGLIWKFMLWISLYDAVLVFWYSLRKMKHNVFPYRELFDRTDFKSRYISERRTKIHSDLSLCFFPFCSLTKATNRKTLLRGMENIWLRDESRWAAQ